MMAKINKKLYTLRPQNLRAFDYIDIYIPKELKIVTLASLHDGASSGEVALGEFIKFCLCKKNTCDISEVLYRVDIKDVIEVFEAVKDGSLYERIKSTNPYLLEHIERIN